MADEIGLGILIELNSIKNHSLHSYFDNFYFISYVLFPIMREIFYLIDYEKNSDNFHRTFIIKRLWHGGKIG